MRLSTIFDKIIILNKKDFMKKYLILISVFFTFTACTKQDNRLGATSNMSDEYKTSMDRILEVPPQVRDQGN